MNIEKNRIRRYFYIGSITVIILLAAVFSFIYTESLNKEYANKLHQLSTGIINEKKRFLRNSVDSTIYFIENEKRRVSEEPASKNLTDEEIKSICVKGISDYIRKLRLIDDGYIWVNHIVNYGGGEKYAIRQIHPNLPHTEGMWLSTNTTDIMGNRPYEAELNGIKKDGELFFDYYFKKMGSEKIVHKISFAKLYKPYDWVVATGVYLDDVDQLIEKETIKMKKTLLRQYHHSFLIALVAILISIVIVTIFEKQIRNLIVSYEDEIERYTISLKEKFQEINDILDSVPAHVAVINLTGKIERANQAWYQFGKDNGIVDLKTISVGVNYLEVCDSAVGVSSEIAHECSMQLKALIKNDTDEFELEYPAPSPNENRWFLMKARRVKYGENIIIAHTDITKTKQLEIQLKAIVNTAGESIINIDQKGAIQLFNPAAVKLFGYEQEEVIGKSVNILLPDDHKTDYENYIEQYIAGNKKDIFPIGQEVMGQKKDGTIFPIYVTVGDTLVESQIGFTVLIHDLTETKKIYAELSLANQELQTKNKELDLLATKDQLTGLYNRLFIEKKSKELIHRCERFSENLALSMVDIDHFKSVNDKYGHDVGDEVLISFARILSDNSRKVDIVGRWGGEEFMILFQTNSTDAVTFAEKLRRIIMEKDHGKAGKITASIGLTQYISGDSLETMTKRADQALYMAKKNGRNRVEQIFCL